MKEIKLITLLASCIFALVLSNASCSLQERTNGDDTGKLQSWKRIISDLCLHMKELKEKKAEAQSFIETAEVHQVTRSNEEKTRQLHNLNLCMTEIEFKIDSMEVLVSMYVH